MIITIDGPSGSGKSTVARLLANRLEFYCISSGILYRALAYVLVRHYHYQPKQLSRIRSSTVERAINSSKIVYRYSTRDGAHIALDGVDITASLKSERIDQASSLLAVNKSVREVLTHFQRKLAQGKDVVIEGRDSGSVVFPDAEFKFFLTASIEIRAARWQADQAKKGVSVSLAQAIQLMKTRDERDAGRAVAPLVIPKGAIIVDTSSRTIEQTLDYIMHAIKVPSTQ